jgi:hypothetical protein
MTTNTPGRREERDVLLLGRPHHGNFLKISVGIDETGAAEYPPFISVLMGDRKSYVYQMTDFPEATYKFVAETDLYDPDFVR